MLLSVYDGQIGDILKREPGHIVSAGGVFIKKGHNVKCDESAATGESNASATTINNQHKELRNSNEAG
ncbi:hypothetical protein MUCCIDRAFT_112521 [Mucor lusitanicus CBS 277.49]|uniref:P-type ATPase A domain-containing protein n=1 Tax=Mucor lusitanicus CBS 277.49 TaxID=747725 RepID=A0A162T4I8_MUCCL|nr:hypothetical protein MUCCIDRAFT_112521 [Mucor lusitanicus CBS 277.49]